MPDIAASNVTHTVQPGTNRIESERRCALIKLDFGDGTLTYPAGGIPLTKGKMGCPTTIDAFTFVDAANDNGFLYKYDLDATKLRIYQGDNDGTADGPLVELGNVAVAATTIYAEVTGW